MKKTTLLLLAIPAALCAQTIINGSRVIKGSLDASGSTRSLPNRTGTGSPSGRDACASPGETYFQTDATAGQNLWVCTAAGTPGTWNQISGSGGSSPAVTTGTTSPGGSCSAGSFYLRTDIQELYVCSGTNVWELASYASGNTASRPIGCVSGQLYVATDTGDLWYCAVAGSLGTWQSVTPLTNVSLNGASQGTFSTLNLVNAPGAIWSLTPNGQTLSISPTPDTTYLLSQTEAQNGLPFLCAPASNNSSTYSCTLTPAPAALTNGMLVEFRPDVSCAGGPTTLNLNSLGAKPVYSADGSSNPAANDCRANRPTWLLYSSALNSGAGAFVLQSLANLSAASGNAAITQTTVPYNSSVTFTRATDIQEFILTLSGNVSSSSTSGFTAGDIYYFEMCQNSTGGYTLAWPASGFTQAPTIDPTPNVCTKFHGTWDTNGILQVAGVPTTSENPFLISQAHERSAPSTPASTFEALWPDQTRNTWTGINSAGNTHIMPRTSGATDQLASTDLSDSANLARASTSNTYASGTTQDAHAAAHTLPAASGSTLPATCTVGEQFFSTTATAGQNLYFCTTTNNWTQQTGGGSGGGGTVSSVSLTVPAGFTVSGSPVTGSGTLAVTANSQSANTVYSGPSSGSAAAPTFRTLVAADIPTLNQNTTGNAATSTALAATPSQCTGGQFATGIAANGNANCATPSGGGAVSSVFGRTGAVTAQAGDYAAAQVTNAAQLNASNTFTAGTQDFHAVSHSLPVVTGTTVPSTCSIGEIFFNTASTAGQNLYFCTAANTWTQMSGGGGGSSTVTENTYIPFGGQYDTSSAASSPGGPGIGRSSSDSASSTPYITVGTGYAVPSFTFAAGTSADYVYIHWMLHQNWTGNVNVVLSGISGSGTAGNAYFTVATTCPSSGTNVDTSLTYNTASTGTLAMSGTLGQYAGTLTLSNVNMTGCSAGSYVTIRVGRDHSNASDTFNAAMYMLGMQIQWQHN